MRTNILHNLARKGDVTISIDESVHKALLKAAVDNLPGLIVMDENSVAGVVLCMELASIHPNRLIMDTTIHHAFPFDDSADVKSVWDKMEGEKIGVHPLLDSRGELVGMLCRAEVMEYFITRPGMTSAISSLPSLDGTVLVVDDSEVVRSSLNTLLTEHGYGTVLAESGAHALDELSKALPSLVLLDIGMPGMSGYEVLKALRSRDSTRGLPVIMLTATTDMESRIAAFKEGADDYIMKPYEEKELLARIGRLIQHKRFSDDRNRLATAIEQAGEAIVITDTKGDIQYVNPAFERITGYSRNEVLGHNTRMLKSGKQGIEFYRKLWATITGGNVWTGRFVNKKKDGSLFHEEATISPVRDADGRIFCHVAVKRDITEEVKLQAKLRESERLASVGQVAGGIAHEIKNPLFAISSGIQLLQMDMNLDEDQKKIFDIIYKETMRADRMIKQLLSYSGRQKLSPVPLKINDLIEEVISLNQGLLHSKEIAIRKSLEKNMPVLMLDRDKIVQVVLNVFQNAIEVSPTGSIIGVGTEVDLPGKRVLIRITDRGPGVPEDIKNKIFDPFFTTRKGSVGMGLSISKKIVNEHGGEIGLEPGPDGGVTFIISLPMEYRDA